MSARRFALGTVVLALGVSLTARELRAQTPATYLTQLQTQLGMHSSDFTNRGYTPVGTFQTASLAAGSNGTHTVDLTGGRTYGILGVCDNDCSDVDLTLFGPGGNQIAQDVATDDYPELLFTAPSSGQYRLQVRMVTCRVSPCYYGVQLYGGASGGAPAPTPMPMAAPQPMPMANTMMAPNPIGMIAFNQQVTGNLTVGDLRYDGKPMQTWGLTCAAGQSLQMDILSSWDNYAILFDPMGNPAMRDDDGGDQGLNARITYTCPAAGMYRLGVTTYTASTTPGAYTLQVQGGAMMNQPQPMNAPQPMNMPQPMAPAPQPMSMGAVPAPGAVGIIATGQTLTGRLETGDRQMTDSTWADIWQFQGQAGQSVTIELRSSEFDTYLQLLDASSNRLAEDDDSLGDLDSRVIYRLPSTGMYQIVVNNFGDTRRAGTYTLTVR